MEKKKRKSRGDNPNHLAMARRKKNMSQQDMAEFLNVSQAYVSQVETGLCFLTDENMERVCQLLSVDKAFITMSERMSRITYKIKTLDAKQLLSVEDFITSMLEAKK